MKRNLVALVLLLAFAVVCRGQEPNTIGKDTALKVIAIFREDPGSELGRGAAGIILRFAKESTEVHVTMSRPVLSWVDTKKDLKNGSLLMVAYVAGSVRSQLESGAHENDALAGAEQVIETYQKLKQADPDLNIPEVEKLIVLKSQGKLKESLDAR